MRRIIVRRRIFFYQEMQLHQSPKEDSIALRATDLGGNRDPEAVRSAPADTRKRPPRASCGRRACEGSPEHGCAPSSERSKISSRSPPCFLPPRGSSRLRARASSAAPHLHPPPAE